MTTVASRTAASASMIEAKPTQSTTPLRVSLCLLVWNELEGCKLDVPGLPLDQFDEVYAVDGGSKDGTVAYLEQHGIKVHTQQMRGSIAACMSQMACTMGNTAGTSVSVAARMMYEGAA